MNYDYTIVMAWFNIREKEENPLRNIQHNNEFVISEDYMKQSRIFIEKAMPLVIFVEKGYESIFWQIRPTSFHSITRVISKDYSELYGYCELFPQFQYNHMHNPIENLHKEKFTALYNFVINQKVEFVKEAIAWNPFNTPKFGWMDLRLHDIPVGEIDQIFLHFPEDRMLITQSWYPSNASDVANRYEWFKATRGKVCAGFFAGYKDTILKFCDLCRIELVNAVNIGRAPTDEMIYSVVVAENLDMFEPHIGDYPDVLHNILYNRANAFFTMNYFCWAYERGYHYYVHRIAENLKGAYYHKTIGFSREDLYKVWYYNYVACFHLGRMEYCVCLREEYLEIFNMQENCVEVWDIMGY
jgi:hypothetical protein